MGIDSERAGKRYTPTWAPLILDIMKDPERVSTHIRSLIGAHILKVAYGYTVDVDGTDPLVELAERFAGEFSQAAQPGTWMVDAIPFLKTLPDWMPGMQFKEVGREWHAHTMELVERPFEFVKQQMTKGTASPSFSSFHLERKLNEEEEWTVKWAAAQIYAAGRDTTAAAIETFYLAMALFPNVLRRAQEEVDSVIGIDQLPTFADRKRLPYIDAILKETLRWNSVIPMGIPHESTSDDIYCGYCIPKGAIVLINIWKISRDPKNYRDPEIFDPERFIGSEGREPEVDPRSIAFGFGRRICSGKDLAEASMFIVIAMSVAAFDIRKLKDVDGRDIEPSMEFTAGFLSHPKEVRCSIRPRSEKLAALIAAMNDDQPWGESDAEKINNLNWKREEASI